MNGTPHALRYGLAESGARAAVKVSDDIRIRIFRLDVIFGVNILFCCPLKFHRVPFIRVFFEFRSNCGCCRLKIILKTGKQIDPFKFVFFQCVFVIDVFFQVIYNACFLFCATIFLRRACGLPFGLTVS